MPYLQLKSTLKAALGYDIVSHFSVVFAFSYSFSSLWLWRTVFLEHFGHCTSLRSSPDHVPSTHILTWMSHGTLNLTQMLFLLLLSLLDRLADYGPWAKSFLLLIVVWPFWKVRRVFTFLKENENNISWPVKIRWNSSINVHKMFLLESSPTYLCIAYGCFCTTIADWVFVKETGSQRLKIA